MPSQKACRWMFETANQPIFALKNRRKTSQKQNFSQSRKKSRKKACAHGGFLFFLLLPFPCEAIRLSDLPAGISQFEYEFSAGESHASFPVGFGEQGEPRVICFAWKRQSVWTREEVSQSAPAKCGNKDINQQRNLYYEFIEQQ